MRRIDTVIIGAGQAGLAVSHELTAHGRDHVLLERGQTAERWRSQSWDSLRLLTPNWMTRLPGHAYRGSQPDGFMRAPELVQMFERYAALVRRAGARIDDGASASSARPTAATSS